MSNFLKRINSCFFIIIWIFCLCFCPYTFHLALSSMMFVLCFYELDKIIFKDFLKNWVQYLPLFFILSYLVFSNNFIFLIGLSLALICDLKSKNFDQTIYMSYVFFMFYGLLAMQKIYFINSYLLLLIFIITAMHDTGGYIFGKTFKGPKIVPSVSPNKTWFGFIGGTVLGILAKFILDSFNYPISFSIYSIIFMNFAGLLGDLIESKIKRIYNVKDSGNLIPGHGGILDRFDSFWMIIFIFYNLLSV